MLIYLSVNVIILLLSIIFLLKKQNEINSISIDKTYLWIIGGLLLFISGFRGDFATDYKGYAGLFEFYNSFSFTEIFHQKFGQEMGYVVLNKLIGLFSSEVVYLMLITSFIIIFLLFREFLRFSPYIWISVLIFVTIGAYYTSFNIIRQILSAAIIFSGSKFLYERKPIQYFLIVLLAAMFHKTAIIMMIFYFILNYKFNFKKLFIALLGLLVTMATLETIISIVQKNFYLMYVQGGYGMMGFNYKNIVLPVSILIFTLVHLKKIDLMDNKYNIWVNSVIFYAFFSVLGMRIQMIQRLSEFFATYVLLLIPYIISKIEEKQLQYIYFIGLIVLLIAFNFLTLNGSGYDPYYFAWSVK